MENNGKPYTNFCLFKVSWRDFNKAKKEEFKMEREIIKSRIAKIKAIQSGLQETVSAEDLNYYYKHSKKLSQIRLHLSMKLLLLAA